ncbi:MAG: OsmC family protein [Hellea sp.]
MTDPVIVKERAGGKYTQDVNTPRHHLFADEPKSYGSADIGPAPYELLCASLGACTSITLRMYVERKGWSVDNIAVKVTHKKMKYSELPPKDVFTREITITGDVDAAQRARMIVIANKCPVHRTLEASSDIETHEAHG